MITLLLSFALGVALIGYALAYHDGKYRPAPVTIFVAAYVLSLAGLWWRAKSIEPLYNPPLFAAKIGTIVLSGIVMAILYFRTLSSCGRLMYNTSSRGGIMKGSPRSEEIRRFIAGLIMIGMAIPLLPRTWWRRRQSQRHHRTVNA